MHEFVRALLAVVIAHAATAMPIVDPATEDSPFSVVIGADNLWNKRWTVITGDEVRLTEQQSTSSRAIVFTATSPGLTREPGTVSFEWQGRPGFFLSNVDTRNIMLQPQTAANKATFNRDATFHLRDALSGKFSELSLECGLNSGQYVVHSNDVLEVSSVDNGSSEDARSRASFFTLKKDNVPTLPKPMVVRSENFPEYAWNKPGTGWMSDADRRDIVKLEQGSGAEFHVHMPGLKSCESENSVKAKLGCEAARHYTVSFEFANMPPGAFLRQTEGGLLVGQRSGGDFDDDATFRQVAALSGNPGYMSFESIKQPGHYIVHNNYHLRVAPVSHREASDVQRKDASFKFFPNQR